MMGGSAEGAKRPIWVDPSRKNRVKGIRIYYYLVGYRDKCTSKIP